jgi:hypothetical protein
MRLRIVVVTAVIVVLALASSVAVAQSGGGQCGRGALVDGAVLGLSGGGMSGLLLADAGVGDAPAAPVAAVSAPRPAATGPTVTFADAYQAGVDAREKRQRMMARLRFGQALKLACTDTERASAHLQLGHSAMSDGLDYIAVSHYRAAVALSAAAAQMRPGYCTQVDPLAFVTADRLEAADLLTEAAMRLRDGYREGSHRPANLSVPRYQNEMGLSGALVAAREGGGYTDRCPDRLGARRYRQAIMATAAVVGKRTDECPKAGQPAYALSACHPSVTNAWDMASYPHPSFAGVNDWRRYSGATQPPLPAVSTASQQPEAAIALDRLERLARKQARLPQREWTLVFEDTFDRSELGPDWTILAGSWTLQDGILHSDIGQSELLLARPLSGMQRIEFEIRSDDEMLSDFSAGLHAGVGATTLTDGCYLVQFGGMANTENRVLLGGTPATSRSVPQRIEPGRWYTVAAERDGDIVRLMVDGRTVVELVDASPLGGAGHDRVGLYIHCAAQLRAVRVYTSEE